MLDLDKFKFVRPYPIVDLSPSFGKVISNFHADDWLRLGATMAGFSVLFYRSSHVSIRAGKTKHGLLLGFVGGMALGMQQSHQRLVGLSENTDEVKRYGAMSDEKISRFLKAQMRTSPEMSQNMSEFS